MHHSLHPAIQLLKEHYGLENHKFKTANFQVHLLRRTLKTGSDPTLGLGPLIISEQGVLKLLSSLNPNKACGPNQIPPWYISYLCCIKDTRA